MSMPPTELAEQLAEMLDGIAELTCYSHVSRVELIVGSLHGVMADDLEMAFEDLLESRFADSKLDGAIVQVILVAPGETFSCPQRQGDQTANGWELLIADIHGIA